MAHTRKDTYVETREWARHLRRAGKRQHARAERRACRRIIAAAQD